MSPQNCHPAKKSPNHPRPKHPQEQKTTATKQKERAEAKNNHIHYSDAVKHATIWYAREKAKKGGILADKIAKKVKVEFEQIGSSARTINCYVEDNHIGMSPKRLGERGRLSAAVYKLLCNAFKSFV